MGLSKYKVVEGKNLKTEQAIYYAMLAPTDPVKLAQLSEEIAHECTLTPTTSAPSFPRWRLDSSSIFAMASLYASSSSAVSAPHFAASRSLLLSFGVMATSSASVFVSRPVQR